MRPRTARHVLTPHLTDNKSVIRPISVFWGGFPDIGQPRAVVKG